MDGEADEANVGSAGTARVWQERAGGQCTLLLLLPLAGLACVSIDWA